MLSIIIGLPLAVLFARLTTYTVRIMRALVLVPLVLPPVVGGIGLLYAFGRRGLVGQHLAVVGIHIPFTEVAVIMAQTFVALPFLVITVEGLCAATTPTTPESPRHSEHHPPQSSHESPCH